MGNVLTNTGKKSVRTGDERKKKERKKERKKKKEVALNIIRINKQINDFDSEKESELAS